MITPRTLVILVFFLLPLFLSAQNERFSETDYADYIQTLIGGQREVTVASGRIDLVTETHAFEIEWAPKWKEAIGQALWYALQTNKKPGIILILEERDEYKYYIQLNSALGYAGLRERFRVLLFPDDFQHLMGE